MNSTEVLRVAVWSPKHFSEISSSELKKVLANNMKVQLTEILTKALGVSYELLTPTDGEVGRLSANGTWTGMMGMMQRNETDLVVGELCFSEERGEVVDFSFPHQTVTITFITRKLEYSLDITAFLKPFSFETWISSVVCLLVMPVLFYVLLERRYSIQNLIFSTLGTFLRQATTPDPVGKGDYLLIFFWLMGIMMLGYSYSAVLLSFLTFPPMQGVRTIPELAAAITKGQYFSATNPGSLVTDLLAASADPNVRIIGRSLQENDGSGYLDEVLSNAKWSKKPAFVDPYKSYLKAKYFVSEDSFFSLWPGIAMQKDFCCKRKLNSVLSYIWASGIYKKIIDDDSFKISMSHHINFPDNETPARQLSVEDFEVVFFVLLAGYILSTVAFLIEIVVSKKHTRLMKENVTEA